MHTTNDMDSPDATRPVSADGCTAPYSETLHTEPSPSREWALLAAWAIVLVVGAALRDPWFPDEPDVAQPMLEMYLTGDWITPRHNGVPWLSYPPLGYWAGAALMAATGSAHPLLVRLPTIAAALALAFLVRRWGARIIGATAAWWAAVALLLFPNFAWASIFVAPDMIFALMQSAGLLAYVGAARQDTRSRRNVRRVLAFALFGLAWLTKGPLGLLMPGLILTVWHVSLRDLRGLLWMAPLSLVAVAVVAPWYVGLAAQHGAGWVWQELVAQNFDRFAAATRGHANPWHYYLVRIWIALAPLSLLIPSALRGQASRLWRDPAQRLLLLWATVPFLFLSVAATKREIYLLPSYPAFAMILALHLCRSGREGHTWHLHARRIAARALLAAGAVALLPPLALAALEPALDPRVRSVTERAWPAVVVIGLAALCARAALMRRHAESHRWWAPPAGFLAASYAAVHLGVLPAVNDQKSYRAMATWAHEALPPSAEIALAMPGWAHRKQAGFLNFLSGERTIRPVDELDQVAAFLAAHPEAMVITGSSEVDELLSSDTRYELVTAQRWEIGSKVYFALSVSGFSGRSLASVAEVGRPRLAADPGPNHSGA